MDLSNESQTQRERVEALQTEFHGFYVVDDLTYIFGQILSLRVDLKLKHVLPIQGSHKNAEEGQNQGEASSRPLS